MRTVLLTVIAVWYQSIDIVENYSGTRKASNKGLSKALRGHLDLKLITKAKRFKFHHRNQHKGKSIIQYIADLRKLSKHCAFRGYSDQALCDRLVCGLINEGMQK